MLLLILVLGLSFSCQREDAEITRYDDYELFIKNLNSEAQVFMVYQTQDFSDSLTLPPTGLRVKFKQKQSGDFLILVMGSLDSMYVDVELLQAGRRVVKETWIGDVQRTLTYQWK